MRTPRASKTLAHTMILAATVGIAATGCASDHNHTGTTTTAAAKPWDACSVPEDLLRRAGVDPKSQDRDRSTPDWSNCGWTGKDILLTVITSSTATLAQVHAKSDNHDFTEVTIGGRKGLMYHLGAIKLDEACALDFAIKDGGIVGLDVGKSSLSSNPRRACDLLQDAAAILSPAFPM